jgi:hypothetical protein
MYVLCVGHKIREGEKGEKEGLVRGGVNVGVRVKSKV